MKPARKSLLCAALLCSFFLLSSCSSHKTTSSGPDLQGDVLAASGYPLSEDVEDVEAEPAEPEEFAGEEIAALNRLGRWETDSASNAARATGYMLSRSRYDFPVVLNRQVGYYLELFQGRQREMFARWLARSAKYVPAIELELAKAGLPRDLAYLAMIESGYNPSAVSRAGAGGLWQFMPATGRHYDLTINSWVDERREPEKATKAAIRYLGNLYRMFGDWHLAVAAYNTGEGKVDQAIRQHGTTSFWELAAREGLYMETRHYVPKLIAAIIIARDPETYGFDRVTPVARERFDVVRAPGNTDLRAVAAASGTTLKHLRSLNNELLRDVTPPKGGTYALRVPAGSGNLIAANIDKMQRRVEQRPTRGYATHVVKRGETLNAVSRRYGVSMTDLLKANRLRSSQLMAGQQLRIPSRGALAAAKGGQSGRVIANVRTPVKQNYQVRKGDTLSGIARKHGVSEAQLRKWNNISVKRGLMAGQKLVIHGQAPVAFAKTKAAPKPAPGGKQVALTGSGKTSGKATPQKSLAAQAKSGGKQPVKVVAKSAAKPVAKAPTWYVVKKGDSMAGIAKKFSVSTSDIRQWNRLPSDKIKAGNRLLVRKG